MIGSWMRLAAAGLVLVLTGCQTAQIAKKVDFVSLSSDTKPGASIGQVKTESCGIKVFGYGSNPDMKTALSRVNARYVNNLNIDRKFENYYVYTRDCWIVTGEGFK